VAVALSKDELALINAMRLVHYRQRNQDLLMRAYYRGAQSFEQLGMMVPPSMRSFRVIANWPRVVVRTITRRQQVKALMLPGGEQDDPTLRAIWEANNLDLGIRTYNKDCAIYGRSFLQVFDGASEQPIVRATSPLEMAVQIVDGQILTAARFYAGTGPVPGDNPQKVSLYRQGITVWAAKRDGAWFETGRDEHGGPIPVIMGLNEALTGEHTGESAMRDVIPLTDSAARALTNMQFGVDAHGLPRLYASGVQRGDFVDKTGAPVTRWEQYFNNVWLMKDPQAKLGAVPATDLKNFDTALETYGKQAATVTGFPGRYFGITSVNPPGEGTVRAEEAELVESVEDQNLSAGVTIGWGMELAYKIKTNEELGEDRILVEWHDPATPTVAQRTDALVKQRQVGALSREGMWDELGWSEARKNKERAYLAAEMAEGLLNLKLDDSGAGNAGFGV
jgi:hypothetical protein